MANITLSFNGTTAHLVSNKDNEFNLNEIANIYKVREPSEWRNAQRRAMNQSANLRSVNGGEDRGTWATEAGLYAYAMWADPTCEFYTAVIKSFTAAAQGNGKLATELARSVARSDGKLVRKGFTTKVNTCYSFIDFRKITNGVTEAAIGKTATELKEERPLLGKKGKPLKKFSARDVMTTNELESVAVVESMMTMVMSRDRTAENCLDRVNQALSLLK